MLMDDSYYTTSSDATVTISDPAAAAAAAGLIMTLFLFFLIFLIVAYVFSAICLGRIFKKAGKESWPAWVPFYNSWVLFELGDQKGAYILFQFIPFVGNIIFMVFQYIAMYNIGLKLSKTGAFILWGIFLAPVWYVWLAFDDSKWNKISAPAVPATTNKN
jgi:hypothetical protein